MHILFAGTGAADWDWSRPLAEGERGCTCTLLDGHVLIDAGFTVRENLTRAGVPFKAVADIVLTHSHPDHFYADEIHALARAPGRTGKLRFFGPPEAVRKLDGSLVESVPVTKGWNFRIGDLSFTALPSNHLVADMREETFHYLIRTPEGKNLLYALDGAWMTAGEFHLFRDRHLDMIVWDATAGPTRNNWRFASHNDLEMIRSMRISLTRANCMDDSTVVIFDHIARTLWPGSPEEREALAREYGGILASDGMETDL